MLCVTRCCVVCADAVWYEQMQHRVMRSGKHARSGASPSTIKKRERSTGCWYMPAIMRSLASHAITCVTSDHMRHMLLVLARPHLLLDGNGAKTTGRAYAGSCVRASGTYNNLGRKMRRLFAVAGAAAGAAAPAAEPPRAPDRTPVEVPRAPDSTPVEDASELVDLFRSVLPDSTAEETQRWLGSADVVSGTHVVWACFMWGGACSRSVRCLLQTIPYQTAH